MKSEAGFTLIELLAALVAGGLLLAALGWTMGGLANDLHAKPRNAELAQVQTLAPQLRTMLAAALPLANAAGFGGTREHFAFRAVPPLALGRIGPVSVDLQVRTTRTGQGLFATLQPDDPAVRLPTSVRSRLLVDGLSDIAIRFAPRDDGRGKGLPQLITIVFRAHDGRTAEIVAEPRMTSDGTCRFDTIAMACRN